MLTNARAPSLKPFCVRPPPREPTSRWTCAACEIPDPRHPSLRFKKLGGYGNVWSVRINDQYRAVGEREGDTIHWAWIGTHNDFDRLFG